jgi:hypothetical protein
VFDKAKKERPGDRQGSSLDDAAYKGTHGACR